MSKTAKSMQYAALALLIAGELLAQGPGPGEQGADRHEKMQQFIANYLNLTDAQKAQAKTIFDDARNAAKPILVQLKEDRAATQDAVKAGDNAKLQVLAQQEGTLIGQIIAIRTQAFTKLYALLTTEQKGKADQLVEHLRFMFGGRLGGGRPGPQ